MPKISVVMPVYNGEKYLNEAIDSILNQTYTNFEFIIIDDGSTDKTEEIIKSYTDNKIIYVKNEKNSGVSYSANKGFNLAKGEYIARMDADDISLINRLEKQISFMDNNPVFGACCTNVIYTNENASKFGKPWAKDNYTPIEWLLLFENPIPQPTIFFRKSIIEKNHYQYSENINYGEDYDLWTRIVLQNRIALLNEVLLHYRVTKTSAFHANTQKAYENSAKSNIILIEKLTNELVSPLHFYLTSFCTKDKHPTNFIEVKKITDWLNTLTSILQEKWNWNAKTIKKVKNDYYRIYILYTIKLPKKLVIKNIHKFYPWGARFYFLLTIRFFYMLLRKVFKGL